jgi:hypothetical protein
MLKMIKTSVLLASVVFASGAQAAVFNPFDAAGSTEAVDFITPGYINSWWVEDDTAGISPGPGQSPAEIRAFVEQSAITGLGMTDDGCREGLGGVDGTNSKCTGNIFAVKVNDLGYLVFQYAASLSVNQFIISMIDSSDNNLSRMDVFTSGQTSDVPIPGALVLLGSGLAGAGVLGRKKRKAA